MTDALQVAIRADGDAIAALRMLVVDTGVAISQTACTDFEALMALHHTSSCDAVIVQMVGARGLAALECLRDHAPTAAHIDLLMIQCESVGARTPTGNCIVRQCTLPFCQISARASTFTTSRPGCACAITCAATSSAASP